MIRSAALTRACLILVCQSLACLSLACLSLACLSLASSPAQADQSQCDPVFPYQDGWLGGDGAYSVPLSAERSLWLFGDSFVSSDGAVTRDEAAFVANSIALSVCTGTDWSIRYAWGGDTRTPDAFFRSDDPDIRYWPLDGVVLDGALKVFLMRVKTLDATNPLGFAIIGTDLATITGFDEDPSQWQVEIVPFGPDTPVLAGAAIVPQQDHLLLVTPRADRPGHPVILTRLTRSGPQGPEIWTGERWMPGLLPDAAETVIALGSSELSLDPHGDRWLAVHMDPLPFSSDIVYRMADSPTGPWSDTATLVTIPDAVGDPTLFCYAAKAHHQFARADTLLLTYACNTTEPARLMRDMTLYVPQTVRVPLPALLAPD